MVKYTLEQRIFLYDSYVEKKSMYRVKWFIVILVFVFQLKDFQIGENCAFD
jgi:hypothetical protein